MAVLAAPFRLVGFVFHLAVPLFALAVALFLGGIYVVPIVVLLHELSADLLRTRLGGRRPTGVDTPR